MSSNFASITCIPHNNIACSQCFPAPTISVTPCPTCEALRKRLTEVEAENDWLRTSKGWCDRHIREMDFSTLDKQDAYMCNGCQAEERAGLNKRLTDGEAAVRAELEKWRTFEDEDAGNACAILEFALRLFGCEPEKEGDKDGTRASE